MLCIERARGVEHAQNHDADVGEDGDPHVRNAERTEHKADSLDGQRKDDVLPDEAHGLARNAHGQRELARIVVHEHDVRRLNGRVRADAAHGGAEIGAREHRRIVDAVADEGEVFPGCALTEQPLDLRDLILRQQLAVHLRDAQLLRHGVGRALAVAGEHDDAHAVRPQAGHRLTRAGLRLVGDDDVAEIRAVGRDVDDRAGLIDRRHGQAERIHQLRVAGSDGPAADLRGHTVTGKLLGIRRDQVGRQLTGRAAQALADRVIGEPFRRRRELQQRLLGQLRLCGVHRRDGERAARERAGLVKYLWGCE